MWRRDRTAASNGLRWRRGSVMAAISAAHVVVLVAILLPVQRPAAAVVPAMALLDFRDLPPAAVPSVDVITIAPPDIEVVAVEPLFLVEPDAPAAAFDTTAAEGAASEECAPEAALQSALSAAPDVQAALATVPAGARSVADAVLLWNAHWAEIAGTRAAPLASVRSVVTRTLRGLPAACLAEPLTGPRLFLVAVPRGTMVLAFGSGTWRWQDVAGPAVAAADNYFQPAASGIARPS